MIESNVEKVYGYAVKHTYSREEADELAQEILYTAIRELPKLKDESRFEPWLWGVARNVSNTFRRNLGKQRAMYSYDTFENLQYEEEFLGDQEEEYDLLRSRIAMLSALYRDIIIMYYYDGLSTKMISERLSVSEGTVKWRLSEARKKLKKECADMKETALRPIKMKLGIYGSGNYNGKTIPFPNVYIDDALSHNILYYCYEEAGSVEDLAKVCGVPAYYVEDRINNLVMREALVEVAKGKYRTDFIIWSDKYGIYSEENAEKILLSIIDELLTAINRIADEAGKIEFYKGDRNENDLWYLYGVMAFDYARKHYCRLPYPRFKKKYDGHEWNYIGNMETGKHCRISMATQKSTNWGGEKYAFISYSSISGSKVRPMMYNNWIDACIDIVYKGGTEDVYSVADAISAEYIIRNDDGTFTVTIPAFTREEKVAFDTLAEKYLAPLMPEYSQIVDEFVRGYKRLFPKHLSDDADRMCNNMFMGMYSVIVEYAQRTGKGPMPSENCFCDVMIQHE